MIEFVVDDDQLQATITRMTTGLKELVDFVAEEAGEQLAAAGGQYSSRIGGEWRISGAGPTERHVQPPEEAWFAHFVAGGTGAHGPARAQKLVFNVNGNTVFADFVSGTPATGFDKEALEATRGNMADIIRRVLG